MGMSLLLLHGCEMDAIGTLPMAIMVALFYTAALGMLLTSCCQCTITKPCTAKEACALLNASAQLWDRWTLELNMYHVMVHTLHHYHLLHSTSPGALPGPAGPVLVNPYAM